MGTSVTLKGLTTHCDTHLKKAKELLIQWRYTTWMDHYSDCVPFGPPVILPDPVIDKIAHRHVSQPDDLWKGTGWSQTHGFDHAAAVFEILREVDEQFDEEREKAKAQRAEARKQETADRNTVKRAKAQEEWALQCEERIALPKKPQASHLKKAVLAASSTQNSTSVMQPSDPTSLDLR